MDYQKLLFAAEVRRLAHDYRVSGRQLHLQGLTGNYDAKAEVQRFDAAHPFANYINDAYRDILDVARQVESLQAAG